jgi:hypothetical protein
MPATVPRSVCEVVTVQSARADPTRNKARTNLALKRVMDIKRFRMLRRRRRRHGS